MTRKDYIRIAAASAHTFATWRLTKPYAALRAQQSVRTLASSCRPSTAMTPCWRRWNTSPMLRGMSAYRTQPTGARRIFYAASPDKLLPVSSWRGESEGKMTIKTYHDFPSIPIRSFDWSAIDEDTYCGCGECRCLIGHGATEQEAIAGLLEQEAQ